MSVNKVDYGTTKAEDTNRGHSAEIWKNCPIADLKEDPRLGFYFRDDFSQTALLATPTITTQAGYSNGWKAFGSTPGTVVGGSIENGQGLVLTSGTSDNDGINVATLALPFRIDRAKGAFWWEARLKTNLITNTRGFVAGLMNQQTLTAIVPITAAGALADVNFVGFRSIETAGSTLDTLYKADGVTAVVVKTSVLGDCPTTTALAADTFIKLGMKFEPYAGPYGSNLLSFFVNGFRLPNTKTIPTTAGDDFPNDVVMGLVFGLVNASAAANIFTIDWVEAAQLSATA